MTPPDTEDRGPREVSERGTSGELRGVIDWAALTAEAVEAMRHAYVPYSKFPVGVAGLVDDGRVVSGCNVENAAYGVTLCAECGMVSDLARSGGGKLVAVSCVNALGESLMPCGRCRQLLWEHGGAACLLLTPLGVRSMADVLPQAFGPDDLDHVAQPARHTADGGGSGGSASAGGRD